MTEETLTDDQIRRIYCVKHGHSRLMDAFFCYHYCARCGDQLGDSLGGVYRNDAAVYVHHMHVFTHGTKEEFAQMRGCTCPENAKTLTEKDFALVPQWNGMGYEQRPPWRKKPDKPDEGSRADERDP